MLHARLSRRQFFEVGAAAGLAGALGRSAAAGAPPSRAPLRIARGVPQLFVDDVLIASSRGLRRTLWRPRKDARGEAPVLALEDEYGDAPGTLEANGTIVFDSELNRYVMFALGFSSPTRGRDRVRLYRFTSEDGLTWVKGDDGRPEHIEIDIPDASGIARLDLFSCTYDGGARRYPYKGWVYVANPGEDLEGVYFVRSADGRQWERGRQVVNAYAAGSDRTYREIRQGGRILRGAGDVTLFSRDPATGRLLGLIKFFSPVAVGAFPGNRLRSRAYAFLDALDSPLDLGRIDHVELLPPAAMENGDEPYDEYYASTAWRYGSMWLGGLKIWHGAGDYPWSAAGCAFLKLVSSRDGLRWQKVQLPNDAGVQEVWVPNGAEGGAGGRNDGGYITEFSQGPLRIRDDLVYYYGSSSWGKNQRDDLRVSGGGIFRARLRVDGFVSVDGGTLTTPFLALPGGRLRLNASGPVDVRVVGTDGRVRGSSTVRGDSIRHNVLFGGRTLGEAAGGTVARLQFAVRAEGRLYSFTVN